MQNLKIILMSFLLGVSLVKGQSSPEDNNYFEIITHTTGSNNNYNTVKFWMNAIGPVWDKDNDPYGLAIQWLVSDYNYAIATWYNDPNHTLEDIPIPNQTSYYGLWHVLTDWYRPDHTYGYGIYQFYIGPTKSDPKVSFKLDLRDCDFSKYYNHNDTWIE